MKIGRNEPCPCGSGNKYKYCCIKKNPGRGHGKKTVSKEDTISISQINDYGNPAINSDFFNENPFDKLSAPMFMYNILLRPDIEADVVKLMKPHISRGEAEEARIKGTEDIISLVEIMKQRPDTTNHLLLEEKILQQSDAAIPLIIDALKHTHNEFFIELAVSIIYKSKIDCSSDVLELIRLPIADPYALSSMCLLLGMIGSKEAIKPLWDCYYFFKENYPHKSYAQAPLIGLYELIQR